MPDSGSYRTIDVDEAVLGKNQALATELRNRFARAGVFVVDIMSSPGSGKTALLEATLARLGGDVPAAVIVGDCATDNDARRLAGHGAQIVQITTGGYCHLDASMIARALDSLQLDGLKLLIIENVGNLVCPASFDLGEDARVVLISVTEGEDKPVKYPVIFARADAVVVNKVDIARAVGWDEPAAYAALHSVAPAVPIMQLSARSGAGLDTWCQWLDAQIAAKARQLAEACL